MSEQILAEILGEIKSLKTDVQDVKSRLGGVENRLGGVENRLDGLERGQAQLAGRLDGLEKGQAELAGSLDVVARAQLKMETRLENEVINKVSILFDARELHNDYFKSIRHSLARIEDSVQRMTFQMIDHDNKLATLEQELSRHKKKKVHAVKFSSP